MSIQSTGSWFSTSWSDTSASDTSWTDSAWTEASWSSTDGVRSETSVRMSFPELPFARLRFRLEAEGRSRLPAYKGSMFRGALGHALRRAACQMGPDVPCGGCAFRQTCDYARLYEFIPSDGRAGFAGGRPSAVRPYIVEAPDRRADFAPGDRLSFGLTLFGQSVELHDPVRRAVASMARRGLGARRHRFRLVETRYEDASGAWRQTPVLGRVFRSEKHEVEQAVLHFVTPTRILHEGRPQSEFSLRSVVEKALRRAHELAHFHTEIPVRSWDFEALLKQVDAVRIVERKTRWVDLDRFSNRQRRRMTLGGVVGRWRLAGPLTELVPVLQLAELVHVGKAASFGFGKVVVDW